MVSFYFFSDYYFSNFLRFSSLSASCFSKEVTDLLILSFKSFYFLILLVVSFNFLSFSWFFFFNSPSSLTRAFNFFSSSPLWLEFASDAYFLVCNSCDNLVISYFAALISSFILFFSFSMLARSDLLLNNFYYYCCFNILSLNYFNLLDWDYS